MKMVILEFFLNFLDFAGLAHKVTPSSAQYYSAAVLQQSEGRIMSSVVPRATWNFQAFYLVQLTVKNKTKKTTTHQYTFKFSTTLHQKPNWQKWRSAVLPVMRWRENSVCCSGSEPVATSCSVRLLTRCVLLQAVRCQGSLEQHGQGTTATKILTFCIDRQQQWRQASSWWFDGALELAREPACWSRSDRRWSPAEQYIHSEGAVPSQDITI